VGWWVGGWIYILAGSMDSRCKQMEQHQHKVIDKNGNLQMEIRPFPQSIVQEKAVEARYLELKALKGEGQ
jgi:ribosomal protein L16/L10AE